MIEDKFRKKINVLRIQQFLRVHVLNDPVGRKAGKHKIKRLHSGNAKQFCGLYSGHFL